MKKYIIFAGVNGAGKSSLYNNLLINAPGENLGQRINTDEIVKEIGDWKRETDQMKAGRIAVSKIKSFLENGISFNQETTLSGNFIIKTIQKAKDKSYKIELHFVSVDTVEIAKERVRKRVENGGHGIPDTDIERRFIESRENLEKIIELCDEVTIYDNTILLEAKVFIQKGNVLYVASDYPKWLEKLLNNLKEKYNHKQQSNKL